MLVLDDHSTDATVQIVRDIAARDARVRLLSGPPLPPGWCGKQHACAVLATHTVQPLLVFVDADVRLAPQGLARLAAFLDASGADLVSGLPRQETGTGLERLLMPLIHFLLLGFLPLRRMRQSRHPAYGSGCGQLFMARRQAYAHAGGHAAIRTSLHDGLTLPRAFRTAGLLTDLCDATPVATCRMYQSAREVWQGLAKNATEGLAQPALLVPATVLLAGGQVLPVVLCGFGLLGQLSPWAGGLAVLGLATAYYPRLRAARRFEQSWRGVLLHPLGILVLLVLAVVCLCPGAVRPSDQLERPGLYCHHTAGLVTAPAPVCRHDGSLPAVPGVLVASGAGLSLAPMALLNERRYFVHFLPTTC